MGIIKGSTKGIFTSPKKKKVESDPYTPQNNDKHIEIDNQGNTRVTVKGNSPVDLSSAERIGLNSLKGSSTGGGVVNDKVRNLYAQEQQNRRENKIKQGYTEAALNQKADKTVRDEETARQNAELTDRQVSDIPIVTTTNQQQVPSEMQQVQGQEQDNNTLPPLQDLQPQQQPKNVIQQAAQGFQDISGAQLPEDFKPTDILSPSFLPVAIFGTAINYYDNLRAIVTGKDTLDISGAKFNYDEAYTSISSDIERFKKGQPINVNASKRNFQAALKANKRVIDTARIKGAGNLRYWLRGGKDLEQIGLNNQDDLEQLYADFLFAVEQRKQQNVLSNFGQ